VILKKYMMISKKNVIKSIRYKSNHLQSASVSVAMNYNYTVGLVENTVR